MCIGMWVTSQNCGTFVFVPLGQSSRVYAVYDVGRDIRVAVPTRSCLSVVCNVGLVCTWAESMSVPEPPSPTQSSEFDKLRAIFSINNAAVGKQNTYIKLFNYSYIEIKKVNLQPISYRKWAVLKYCEIISVAADAVAEVSTQLFFYL